MKKTVSKYWEDLAKRLTDEPSVFHHDNEKIEDAELVVSEEELTQLSQLMVDVKKASVNYEIDSDLAWRKVHLEMHKHNKSWFLQYASIAATLAILIIGYFMYLFYSNTLSNTLIAQSEPTDLVLVDGTRVSLNTGSEFEYPTQFSSQQRLVKLKGEAYFEVAKDANVPFVIATELVNIKVLGTAFNVKSYSDDKLVRVAVSAGRVLVSTVDSTLSVELFEGDMLEFSVTDKRFIKSKLINANYKAWLTGELVFNNMPLSDVFNTLEEVYRVKITTDKSLEVQNEVLNATFTNYSFSHVMTSVCASFNLNYRPLDDGYVVYLER